MPSWADADQLEGLCISAPVHDSGKFSIPAEILAKPTAPKPEEFELLRTYVMATSSVLAPIHVLSPVAGGRNRAASPRMTRWPWLSPGPQGRGLWPGRSHPGRGGLSTSGPWGRSAWGSRAKGALGLAGDVAGGLLHRFAYIDHADPMLRQLCSKLSGRNAEGRGCHGRESLVQVVMAMKLSGLQVAVRARQAPSGMPWLRG